MLSTHELRVFLAAADTENFSEAARRLGISQPAVSMQIKALEERLDQSLFRRSGRHIGLSEAGRALIPMARQMVEQAIHIEESMASLQGEVMGLLKLACSTTAGKYILPQLLARMLERNPQVEVVCQVTPRENALDLLRAGEAHIALTSLRIPYKEVEYRPFLTDSIILIVPLDHPWASINRPLRPAELLEGRYIFREDGSGTGEAVREGLAWHDLAFDSLPRIMTLGNAEAIRMAVQEGIGAAFVSTMVAAEAISNHTVAAVEMEGVELTKTLYMAYNTDRPATRAQLAFWDFAFSEENEHIRRRLGGTLEPIPVVQNQS